MKSNPSSSATVRTGPGEAMWMKYTGCGCTLWIDESGNNFVGRLWVPPVVEQDEYPTPEQQTAAKHEAAQRRSRYRAAS